MGTVNTSTHSNVRVPHTLDSVATADFSWLLKLLLLYFGFCSQDTLYTFEGFISLLKYFY